MNTEGDSVGVTLLSREGLIDAVILKHNRMLEKYNFEFEELDNRFSSYSKAIDDNNKRHEEILERIEVLKEKRQQLYHQAEMMIEKLIESGIQQKDVDTIKDYIRKAKHVSSENEEKTVIESVFSILFTGKNSEIKANFKSKIDEALASHEELISMLAIEASLSEERKILESELNKAKPRHTWLEKRIQSHKEALNYWESLKKGGNEVATA
jgi:chromosome segregation ATPase